MSARSVIAFGILVFILLASFVLVQVRPSRSQSTSAITEQWVDQMLVQWKPSSFAPMGFGVLFPRASYDNIMTTYNTPEVQNADLNMLVGTNASYIRMDIGFDAWLQGKTAVQQEVTTLVDQVRSDGKTLIIADAAAESYRHGGQIPWIQFQEAWVQRVQTLASLYHPDYYVVIKEPGWYAPMISDATTNPAVQDPNSWLNLTRVLADTVHSVSPNTQVGVAIAADSLSTNTALYTAYLRGLASISSVSFEGFDIYTTTGFNNTQNFLNEYGDQGKDVWIAECWSGSGSVAFDSSRSTLDQKWIQLVYYFGEDIGAKMVIPFFTDIFASYGLTSSSPTDPTQIISLYSQRTPVYYSYGNVIASNSGQPNTTTSTTTSLTTPTTQTTVSTSHTSSTRSTSQAGGGERNLLPVAAGLVVVVVVVAVAVALARRRNR